MGGHSGKQRSREENLPLIELENRIKEILNNHIETETLAKHIMTSPVKTLDVHTTIKASKIMLRYGHNGFPVMDKEKLVGIITRQEIFIRLNTIVTKMKQLIFIY